MLLLMLVVAPMMGVVFQFAFGTNPWPVGVAVLLFGGGGLLRIAYALMFESKIPAELPAGSSVSEFVPSSAFSTAQLPPRQDLPAADYISPRTSPESVVRTPGSVTERTTRLLDDDPELKQRNQD